jgi:hypothetical protein
MAFNSDTYHMNKRRRAAWRHLNEARAIHNRVREGSAYDWEARRIPTIVALARSSMRLYLICRRIKEIGQ